MTATQTNGHYATAETTSADLRVPIRVFATFDGWPVHIDLLLAPGRLGAAIDRLQALGYEPQRPAAPAQSVPVGVTNAGDRLEPYIDGDGDYACPVHRRKLKQGSHGWYCSTKAKPGEAQNAKGYCTCAIKE